ncbi:hypothetical protein PUN28_013610 [Cardiocondyla obscurior]|uniref:Uncharacterized protein n=1 Tax=Cardiocondyla obscurior TaxID=286306 RepID=A0AAW2F6F4_9HYME
MQTFIAWSSRTDDAYVSTFYFRTSCYRCRLCAISNCKNENEAIISGITAGRRALTPHRYDFPRVAASTTEIAATRE